MEPASKGFKTSEAKASVAAIAGALWAAFDGRVEATTSGILITVIVVAMIVSRTAIKCVEMQNGNLNHDQ